MLLFLTSWCTGAYTRFSTSQASSCQESTKPVNTRPHRCYTPPLSSSTRLSQSASTEVPQFETFNIWSNGLVTCVTATVLQRTRVSSGDASKSGSGSGGGGNGKGNGNGMRMGTGTGSERERERKRELERETETNSVRWTYRTRTDNVRRTCRKGRRRASDGRVGPRDAQRRTDVSDKNGQCQTEVLNRETDSVGRTCRTETGGTRRVLPIRRYGGNGGNGGNRDEVGIPNRIQEVA